MLQGEEDETKLSVQILSKVMMTSQKMFLFDLGLGFFVIQSENILH